MEKMQRRTKQKIMVHKQQKRKQKKKHKKSFYKRYSKGYSSPTMLVILLYCTAFYIVVLTLQGLKGKKFHPLNKTEHAVHSYAAGQGYFSAMLSSAQQY